MSAKEALERARQYIKPAHPGDIQADADLRAVDAALATFQPDGERREAITSPSDDLIGFAIQETFGGRCSTSDADCYTCQAWSEYDRLASGLVQDEAGWRDISTAPKNHSPVLTWSEQGGRCVAFLDVTWTWWPCPATEPLSNKPTHWMPLPAIRSARDGGTET